MKKKVILLLAIMAIFTCLLAITASAGALTNYASVELTLVDGTKTTGYCEINGRFLRDNVYKNPEETGDGTYAWGDIKIFDMRNSVIVGTKTYNEIGGTNCNNQAVNVEEFYFSRQVTKILNTTFTSGWKKLKTVYVPNTVTEIQHSSFQNSPVERVILEEGTVIKKIGDGAFNGCTNLTSFDFREGLESLGYNCFWNSGLSGTVVIPNSVTYLGPGSLLSTKIENLYLGDGALQIGHNFVGTHSRTDNQYLKNVYIHASTTFTQSNIFYKCANPVNFYVVGTKDECANMVATLKSQSSGNYLTFITADEVTEETGAGYAIIHTGYNKCDAFYGSNHLNAEETYDFKSFEEKSYLRSVCTRCQGGIVLKEIEPLFVNLGFSAAEFGDMMSVNYRVNEEAILAYEEVTGKTVSYGVFAVTKANVGNNDIFDENGEARNGVIAADITDCGYGLFNLKIFGFTDEQKKIDIAMGAFVGTEKDGKVEYSYLQIAPATEGEKYFFASYNKVLTMLPSDEGDDAQ